METESSEPAPAASGAAAPRPTMFPFPRMRTQSQKLSELDDLDLGPVPAVEAATVQAEAPSDGAQPTLDTAPRGTWKGLKRKGWAPASSAQSPTWGLTVKEPWRCLLPRLPPRDRCRAFRVWGFTSTFHNRIQAPLPSEYPPLPTPRLVLRPVGYLTTISHMIFSIQPVQG